MNERTLEDSRDGPTSKFCKVSEERIIWQQQIVEFEQCNILLLHMSKQASDCGTFILKETLSQIEYTHFPLKNNYRLFIIMYQYLRVAKIDCFCGHLSSLFKFCKVYINLITKQWVETVSAGFYK